MYFNDLVRLLADPEHDHAWPILADFAEENENDERIPAGLAAGLRHCHDRGLAPCQLTPSVVRPEDIEHVQRMGRIYRATGGPDGPFEPPGPMSPGYEEYVRTKCKPARIGLQVRHRLRSGGSGLHGLIVGPPVYGWSRDWSDPTGRGYEPDELDRAKVGFRWKYLEAPGMVGGDWEERTANRYMNGDHWRAWPTRMEAVAAVGRLASEGKWGPDVVQTQSRSGNGFHVHLSEVSRIKAGYRRGTVCRRADFRSGLMTLAGGSVTCPLCINWIGRIMNGELHKLPPSGVCR